MDNIRLTNIFKVSQRLLLVLIFAATLVPAWKAQADAAPSPSSRILQENDAKTLRDGRSESTAAANTLEILAVSRPNKVYLPAITGPAGIKPRYFSLLPPGSKLPSDAACAAAIKRKPENKRVNKTYNATTGNGQRLKGEEIFSGDDPKAVTDIAPRVTGNFTGTTDEILQWAACKWGIDEDMVRAQAARESWWRQDVKGDWSTNSAACPPGHGLGVDGEPGKCPESWGILQNRYQYEKSSWPGIQTSTAFNADTAYAIWRVCYEGYTLWLNQQERGAEYKKGDAWGCMGAWFSGRWYTDAAKWYIDGDEYNDGVKDLYNKRIWTTAGFQEP